MPLPEEMNIFVSEKFSHPKFGFNKGARLDFKWMDKQGRDVVVLTDDLYALAEKHGLFDHTPKPEKMKQIDDLRA
eukprot:CAMPEP_0176354206 /NCGR_PEP_ID=MMETSP0126-20121128/12382_1 /TAXON_ID=141414 ORGANISM="Strombidinopsis acuminatum, Strain SPMC142" /NCGR_SAMPLE_ID=MMETSP0126 /ASSEMBLY_ACC=CAM_ASM_000229 /LENGTH=74 /DNA_ID=CAMNT_0017706263 /DNA_START=1920 /DNA_END=2144 /DNA_ORIENTATION=-